MNGLRRGFWCVIAVAQVYDLTLPRSPWWRFADCLALATALFYLSDDKDPFSA